jgi:uncharacterized RDD family membrane protein YckC
VGGRQIELPEGELTVGRSRTCAVMLNDLSVSRNHALVVVRPGRVTVKDLDSSNGTYLNGIRLAAEAEVADGDRLTIGETDVVVHITPPADLGARTQMVDVGARCGACGTRLQPGQATCPSCGKAQGAAARVVSKTEMLTPVAASAPGPPPAIQRDSGQVNAPTEPMRDPLLPPVPPPPPLPPLAVHGGPPRSGGEVLPPLDEAIFHTPPAQRSSPAVPAVEAAASPVAAPAAGFGIRLLAYLVDAVVVAVVAVGAQAVLGFDSLTGAMVASGLALVVLVGMPVVGWSRFGTTPGKRIFGLVVLGPDGRPGMTLGRAFLRLFGYLLSTATLGIGFLLIAFTPARKGLHDHLAGTTVVRAR